MMAVTRTNSSELVVLRLELGVPRVPMPIWKCVQLVRCMSHVVNCTDIAILIFPRTVACWLLLLPLFDRHTST